ncbi:hypothetical protein AB0M57_28415 [Streptomyces sp. NPDC051597]|uniref:hypothetical protein n=1 Tax=Streptomyces sp. NPDC051597 TaxID=3155049 RepID=UPI003412DA90
MTTEETPRYVRLRVDLVLEIDDAEALTGAALERIAADELLPDQERAHARSAVREDEAEALAYLVDPFDLVARVPGVELAQASWSSEEIAYDPDDEDWDLDEEDEGDEEDEAGDEEDEAGGGDGPRL